MPLWRWIWSLDCAASSVGRLRMSKYTWVLYHCQIDCYMLEVYPCQSTILDMYIEVKTACWMMLLDAIYQQSCRSNANSKARKRHRIDTENRLQIRSRFLHPSSQPAIMQGHCQCMHVCRNKKREDLDKQLHHKCNHRVTAITQTWTGIAPFGCTVTQIRIQSSPKKGN